MTSRILISSIVFLAVALSATPALSGGPPPPPQKTVVERCTDNWNNSSASQTCSNAQIVKVMNYQCRITADCQRPSGGSGSTWKTLDPGEAHRLVNCSGNLKLDSC